MLKAPSVQALLAAVRLKAVIAPHSKAISAVSVQSKIRSLSKGKGSYKKKKNPMRCWVVWVKH